LKISPASHITRKDKDKPSPERRRKFSMIWGEKTTSQQAMEILPVMPEMVSAENCGPLRGGGMLSSSGHSLRWQFVDDAGDTA
jgi:hypothetical protein